MILNKLENSFYELLNEIKNEKDSKKVSDAYIFAKKWHEWQKRKSWDNYIIHPLAVAISLWNKFKNIDLLISWLLHDTVEDCNGIIMENIYKQYWENIWFIVDSVTKTHKNFLNSDKIFNDEREKILYGWLKNVSCILLKLADREHNLATLSYMPKNKQIKKSFESQALYLPLIQILHFKEKNNSIEKSQKYLDLFLEKNKIKNIKELKNKLLNTCFHNFSDDIFNIVYNNSNNVVWEIEDK